MIPNTSSPVAICMRKRRNTRKVANSNNKIMWPEARSDVIAVIRSVGGSVHLLALISFLGTGRFVQRVAQRGPEVRQNAI
jgi:hypothetical protein